MTHSDKEDGIGWGYFEGRTAEEWAKEAKGRARQLQEAEERAADWKTKAWANNYTREASDRALTEVMAALARWVDNDPSVSPGENIRMMQDALAQQLSESEKEVERLKHDRDEYMEALTQRMLESEKEVERLKKDNERLRKPRNPGEEEIDYWVQRSREANIRLAKQGVTLRESEKERERLREALERSLALSRELQQERDAAEAYTQILIAESHPNDACRNFWKLVAIKAEARLAESEKERERLRGLAVRLKAARDALDEGAMRPAPLWEWEDLHNAFMDAANAVSDQALSPDSQETP